MFTISKTIPIKIHYSTIRSHSVQVKITCQSVGLNKDCHIIIPDQFELVNIFDNSDFTEWLKLPEFDDVKYGVLEPKYNLLRDAIIEVHRKLGLGVLQPTLEIFAMILFELVDNCTKIEIFESNGLYCSYEGEIE